VRTVIAVCLVAVTVAAAPARAETDPPKTVDGMWVWPRRSIGVFLGGGGSRLAGHSVGGLGPTVDLAVGDGRFQYFGELSLWFASVGAGTGQSVSGVEARAGVGVRWLARSFVMERDGAIEMILEAVSGVEQFWWKQGGRLTRPDFGAGWGWQVRLRKHKFAFRTSARVFFAPSDPDDATAICRGECMQKPSAESWSSGLMVNMGAAW
jgi:hypothetical protein